MVQGGGIIIPNSQERFADLDISHRMHVIQNVSPRTLAFPDVPDRNGFDWYLMASKVQAW